MLPALEYPGSVDWATPRVDGQLSDRLIYPAGAVLAFVPARAVGLEIRVVAWGAALVLGALAIAAVPPRWAIAPVAALLGARNVVLLGAMGDFDVLWLLPLVAAFILRLDERWLAAGLAFGLACSVKQIPWLIAPFLLIQHYRMGGAAWRGVLKGLAAGAAVFAALNLPFFVADPGIWIRNIITPVGQTLPKVPQGVGITLLSYVGIYPLSTTWHTAALVTVAAVLALATWWYPHRVSHAVWLFPMPLLFVRLRSFASYFGSFTILVLLATMAQFGLVRWSVPDPRDLWRPRTDAATEPVVSDD
jgi:uncharacterized membrane protein